MEQIQLENVADSHNRIKYYSASIALLWPRRDDHLSITIAQLMWLSSHLSITEISEAVRIKTLDLTTFAWVFLLLAGLRKVYES